MWKEKVRSSQNAEAFMAGCDPRMREAFVEMAAILRALPGLKESAPGLPAGIFLLCFCEGKCLDCHPLIPLLQMAVDGSPGTGLGILPHRENRTFLEELLDDPTLPTLPATFILAEGMTPKKALFGRPEEMDVVTWRTGNGWDALFRWLRT